MHILLDIFKSRHVGIPGTPGARTAQQEERAKGPWNIPKFHALIHIATGLWLFGRYDITRLVHTPPQHICTRGTVTCVPLTAMEVLATRWQNTSAEAIEARHKLIKEAADRTNQKASWCMQVLVREKRQDDVSSASASLSAVDEDSASNQPSTRHTCIWSLVEDYQSCSRVLGARVYTAQRRKLTIDLASFAMRDNIWTTKDVNGDLCDLPYALAKYLQGLLYKVVDYIPTPSQQRLDADLLFKILGHMQPYERYGAAESTAQLAIFSHIKITHPRSDAHVRLEHTCPTHCQCTHVRQNIINRLELS